MSSIISLIVSIILTTIGATISFTANTMTIMSTTLISTGVAALGISGIFFIVVDRPDDFDDDNIGRLIYYASWFIAFPSLFIFAYCVNIMITTGDINMEIQTAIKTFKALTN